MTSTCPSTLSLFSNAHTREQSFSAGERACTCAEPHAGSRFAPVFSVCLVRERAVDASDFSTPADAARLFCRYLDGCDREHFAVAMLTAQHCLIGIHTAHVGGLTSCAASPREVFKVALLANAAAVIVAHNHPSGNLEPSAADVRVSQVLRDAGRLMDVPLLDSLVIGFGGAFTSLAARGMLR